MHLNLMHLNLWGSVETRTFNEIANDAIKLKDWSLGATAG